MGGRGVGGGGVVNQILEFYIIFMRNEGYNITRLKLLIYKLKNVDRNFKFSTLCFNLDEFIGI